MKYLDNQKKEIYFFIKKTIEREQSYRNGKKIIKSIKTPTDLRRFQEIIDKNYNINKKIQFEKIAEVTKDRRQEDVAFFTRLVATVVPLYVTYTLNDYLDTSYVANIVAGGSGIFGACMAISLISRINSYRENHRRFKNVCCVIGSELNKEQADKMADLVKHCAYVERLEKEKNEKKATQEKTSISQEKL